MNPTNVSGLLGNQIVRSTLVLVAPGSLLLAPYAYLLVAANNSVSEFASREVGASVVLFLMASVVVGLLLENLGALIESEIWDKRLERVDPNFQATWRAYWTLAFAANEEPIGQHYIRTMVLQMKAEGGVSLAVLFGLPGGLAVASGASWPVWAMSVSCFAVVVLTVYLGWESYQSAKVLADVRSELVQAFPRGDAIGADRL